MKGGTHRFVLLSALELNTVRAFSQRKVDVTTQHSLGPSSHDAVLAEELESDVSVWPADEQCQYLVISLDATH